MGAKSKYWLKLHYEMLDDPKIGMLPDHLFRRWVNLLLIAGEQDDGGFLPSVDTIAWRLRPCEIETLEGDLSQLEAKGLVNFRANSAGQMIWHVTNFEKRQERTSDAERQRRYRERKRKETKEKERKEKDIDVDIDGVTVTPVTIRNGNVTQSANAGTVGGDDWRNHLTPEERKKVKAVDSLLRSWSTLTGRTLPEDPSQRKEHYTSPAAMLLDRFDWHVSDAFTAVKRKRTEMLGQGKTPFKLGSVVPYLVAEADAQGINATGNRWWE